MDPIIKPDPELDAEIARRLRPVILGDEAKPEEKDEAAEARINGRIDKALNEIRGEQTPTQEEVVKETEAEPEPAKEEAEALTAEEQELELLKGKNYDAKNPETWSNTDLEIAAQNSNRLQSLTALNELQKRAMKNHKRDVDAEKKKAQELAAQKKYAEDNKEHLEIERLKAETRKERGVDASALASLLAAKGISLRPNTGKRDVR